MNDIVESSGTSSSPVSSTAAEARLGRLLGIDHGTVVIGLAISDPNRILARPLQLLRRSSRDQDFAAINTIIAEQNAAGIIVGLPETSPGFSGVSQAETVRLWAARLAGRVAVPVYLWNETLSTDEARRIAAERGLYPERVDDLAAAVILQTFLDEHPSGAVYPPPVRPGRHSR